MTESVIYRAYRKQKNLDENATILYGEVRAWYNHHMRTLVMQYNHDNNTHFSIDAYCGIVRDSANLINEYFAKLLEEKCTHKSSSYGLPISE